MVAGGAAGTVAWASVYPLDMLKSRIQATSRAASEYTGNRQFSVGRASICAGEPVIDGFLGGGVWAL